MPRELYQTVKEIGDRLEVSEATVRGWIKDGALRAIDIGKGWRIADRDLDDFLTRRETRARDEAFEDGTAAADSTPEHGG